VFETGVRVRAQQEQQVYLLSYQYAFARAPDHEVVASLGMHLSEIRLKLEGEARVVDEDGNLGQTQSTARSANTPAPLPMIGVRGSWTVSPRWVLDAGAALFKLKYDGYDGAWYEARAGATWM
jgi:hypothetical protein